MSKLERQTEVKFRRKYAIKGNTVKVVAVPSDLDIYMEQEYPAMQKALGEEFWVHAGDETGVLIQLPGIHDLSWLPVTAVERVR